MSGERIQVGKEDAGHIKHGSLEKKRLLLYAKGIYYLLNLGTAQLTQRLWMGYS